MSESHDEDTTELPEMVDVGKKRSFTTVTTTGKAVIKECEKAADEDKLAELVKGLELATKEYVSIMLEKCDLKQILTHSPRGAFLYRLDFAAFFDINRSQLEKAKVSF